MGKRPTPKQKLCKPRTRARYGAYQTKQLQKLAGKTNLVKCSSCGEKKPPHIVCKECGKYRGRQVLDIEKDMKKITKIQA